MGGGGVNNILNMIFKTFEINVKYAAEALVLPKEIAWFSRKCELCVLNMDLKLNIMKM